MASNQAVENSEVIVIDNGEAGVDQFIQGGEVERENRDQGVVAEIGNRVDREEDRSIVAVSPESPTPSSSSSGESSSKVIILNTSNYDLLNQSYVSFDGKLPEICIICEHFMTKKTKSKVKHLDQHPHDNICTSCMAIIFKRGKPCPLCREKNMEIICTSCNDEYTSASIVTCFHGHKNLHLCLFCLFKIFTYDGRTKFFTCPKHTEATHIDLHDANVPNEVKRVILYMSVVRKSVVEIHQYMQNINHSQAALIWWNATKDFASK